MQTRRGNWVVETPRRGMPVASRKSAEETTGQKTGNVILRLTTYFPIVGRFRRSEKEISNEPLRSCIHCGYSADPPRWRPSERLRRGERSHHAYVKGGPDTTCAGFSKFNFI